jgi:hypothetical protein
MNENKDQHEANRARFLRDGETLFQFPEISERDAPGLFGKVQGLLSDIHAAACTLRICGVLGAALKNNPDLDLGARINVNGTELIDRRALGHGVAELIDAESEDNFPI